MLSNKNLKIYSIPPQTDEWYKFRTNGIGASEGFTIYSGKMSYNSCLELFHKKIGNDEVQYNSFSSFTEERLGMGHWMESMIADMARYWDGSKGSHVRNKMQNIVIREFLDIKSYIVNPKYPFFFASPDRVIKKGDLGLTPDFDILPTDCPLEIKNVSFNSSSFWKNDAPKMYIVQVYIQMIAMEAMYGELVRLIDGNDFSIIPLERNDFLADDIINVCNRYWRDRIIPARQAWDVYVNARNFGDKESMKRAKDIIQMLEPEALNSADGDFIASNFESESEYMIADKELFDLIIERQLVHKVIKELEAKKAGLDLMLKDIHKKYSVEKIKLSETSKSYSRFYRKGKNAKAELNIMLKDDDDIPRDTIVEKVNLLNL